MKAGMKGHPLVHLGGNMWALFPWLGSYAFLALERFLKLRCGKALALKGLSPSRPYYMQFTMKVQEEEFYRITAEEASKDFDPMELLYPSEVPVFEKYDEYVPPQLVRKGFAAGVLDIEESSQLVRKQKQYRHVRRQLLTVKSAVWCRLRVFSRGSFHLPAHSPALPCP